MKITVQHQLLGHNSAIYALKKAGNTLYSAAGDGFLVAWDLANPDPGKLVAQAETQLFCLELLPENGFVAGDMNGGVHWLFPDAPEKNRHVAHHKKGCFGAFFMDKRLLSLGADGVLSAWDTVTHRVFESQTLSNSALRAYACCPERNLLAVAGTAGHIFILDAGSLTLQHTIFDAHEKSIFCLTFSPDNQYLLSGGRDAQLIVWDIQANYTKVWQEAAHWFTINSLAFSPDGKWLASASRDKTIRIWEADTLRLITTLDAIKYRGHKNSVNSVCWASNSMLFSGGDDRKIVGWEIESD